MVGSATLILSGSCLTFQTLIIRTVEFEIFRVQSVEFIEFIVVVRAM